MKLLLQSAAIFSLAYAGFRIVYGSLVDDGLSTSDGTV